MPAGEEEVVRLYDLEALVSVSTFDNELVDWRPNLESAMLDVIEPEGDLHSDEPEIPVDLERLIHAYLSWDGTLPEGHIAIRGTRMVARATPAVHAGLERFLADLEEHLIRPVLFEAYVLPPLDVHQDRGAVLTAREVDDLLGACTVRGHARAIVPPGKRARLVAHRWTQALYDYDAEGPMLPDGAVDPIVTVVASGLELGCAARPSARGGWLVRLWGRDAELGPMPRTSIEAYGGAEIELPSVHGTCAEASARVEDGGGLLIGQDWTGDGFWLVRVRSFEGDSERRVPKIVSTAGLTTRPFLPWAPRMGGPEPSGGLDPWPYEPPEQLLEDPKAPMVSYDDLLDLVAHGAFASTSTGLQELNHAVHVPEVAEQVRARIAELERQAGDTLTCDLRFGFVPREMAGDALRGKLDVAGLVSFLDRRVLGACRAGAGIYVLGARQRNYLKDYDIEISGSAHGPDPVISSLANGISFWCRPAPLQNGSVAAWTETSWIAPTRPSSMHAVLAANGVDWWRNTVPPPFTAELELPQASRLLSRSMVVLEPGVWKLLCLSDVPFTEGTFAAVLRIERPDRD